MPKATTSSAMHRLANRLIKTIESNPQISPRFGARACALIGISVGLVEIGMEIQSRKRNGIGQSRRENAQARGLGR